MKSLVLFALLLSVVTAANISPVIQSEDTFTSARITGGKTAAEGQFPYQAGLIIKVGNDTSFCGGTLISKQDILTAAHCCDGAVEMKVILGSVNIHNTSDPNQVSMNVTKANITIHNGWNPSKLENDICMIKLPEPVELSEHIKLADLPKDDSENYSAMSVIASGWGRVSDATQTISPDLQFVKLKIISNRLCNIIFLGMIKDTNICTSGAGGMSTCNGDSGGPIVLESCAGNSSTVVGVTSFGISFGCERGWPAVFTRVSKYLKWIQENMS